MRNLKRVLSLTLASVMLLGMMVVGVGAAGYPDVSDEDNVEAIEVLQAVEVMVGDENGNFGPEQQVNRAQMAVIMANLLDLDYNYYQGQNIFWDVPAWAAPYAAACYANGIILGYGGTTFGAADPVTAVQAASMMMRALGYFQYSDDYEGDFELSTVKKASEIGMFNQVDASAKDALTRNEVAQIALNALRSEVVSFTGTPGTQYTSSSGETLSIGYRAEYTPRTSTEAKYNAIEGRTSDVATEANHKGQYYIQLGEQLYDGELRLTNYDVDPFGRPARTWQYKGEEIGTYVKEELLRQTYTTKVTGKMLYELLTENTIKTFDSLISIDGETTKEVLNPDSSHNYGYFTPGNLIRTNTEAVGRTGNGVITEVYVDTLKETYYISVINTYLAKASGNYNEKTEKSKLEVWNLTVSAGDSSAYVKASGEVNRTLEASSEDFDVKDVKDGDIYLVQVAQGEIQKMIDPEVIDQAKINSFKRGDWVVSDGTKYTYNNAIRYDTEVLDAYDDFNMKDTVYCLYLDPNGFVLGVEIVEESDQYVFLTGLDRNGSNIANKTATGNVIFLDGTVATVDINMDKSKAADGGALGSDSLMNTWCTYSVNSNGTYTLIEVANSAATFNAQNSGDKYNSSEKHDKLGQGWTAGGDGENGLKIDKKNIWLNGIVADATYKTVYGNDDSVYITVETTQLNNAWTSSGDSVSKAIVIDDVDTVSTGIQNTSILAWNVATTRNNCENYTDPTILDKYVSSGVYTLFNEKGYVVAAVVVGEDDGATAHFAFVHSSNVNQEDWEATSEAARAKNEDGIYTWYRKVIMNGEETTLIEKTDTNPEIGQSNMKQHNWYEVRFKEDGTVRKVVDLQTKFADATNNGYVTSLQGIDNALKAKDTVLLHTAVMNTKDIAYKGSTLQVETNEGATSYGFPVSGDAKIVVLTAKAVDGSMTDPYGYITTFEGAKGLETAIAQLNDNFVGRISAVFSSGLATEVVINDLTPTNIVTGIDWSTSYTLTLKGNLIDADYNKSTIRYTDGKGNTYTPDEPKVVLDGNTRVALKYTIPSGAQVIITDEDVTTDWFTNVKTDDGKNTIGVRAEAKNNSISFTLTGNLTLDGADKPTSTDPETEGWTLELSGAKLGDKGVTSVWSKDGKTKYTNFKEEETARGSILTWTLPKNTEVMIKSDTGVISTAGNYDMTCDNGTATAVVAEAGYATIQMTGNIKMSDADFGATNRTYTITVEEGMTLSAYAKADGTSVSEANAVKSVSEDGTVYTMYANADVTKFKVRIDSTKNDAKHAFVVERLDIDRYNTTRNAGNVATADCTTTAQELVSPNPNHNVYVIGGSLLTVKDVNCQCFGLHQPTGWNETTGSTWILKRGTSIPVNIDMEDDGVETAIRYPVGSTVYAKDESARGGFLLYDDQVLVGAYKVTLGEGVTAHASSDGSSGGTNLTAGTWYVAKGAKIGTFNANAAGTGVIDASNGLTASAALSSVVTVNKNLNLVAAVKVIKNTDIIGATYKLNGRDNDLAWGTGGTADESYVVAGTEIEVKANPGVDINKLSDSSGAEANTDAKFTGAQDGQFRGVKLGVKDVKINHT